MNNAVWRVIEEIKSGPEEHRRVRSDDGQEEVMHVAVLRRDASDIDTTSDFTFLDKKKTATVQQPVELDSLEEVDEKTFQEDLKRAQAEQERLKALAERMNQQRLAKLSKLRNNETVDDGEE